MPLSIAHPVAVLPFRRFGLPLSALIAGSIAPDLEYVLRLEPRSEVSHTLAGLFLFCVPVSLISLWLFHRIWKQPISALLRLSKDDEVPQDGKPFDFWPFHRFVLLCAAILLGAATHVGWDSFTHPYGWMVEQIPSLKQEVFQTAWGTFPLYRVLQHGSTLIGLAILALITLRFRTSISRISTSAWTIMALIITASATAGIVIAMLKTGIPHSLRGVHQIIGACLVSAEAVLIVKVTLLSLVWKLMTRKRESPEQE
jgi:hypothetical protein